MYNTDDYPFAQEAYQMIGACMEVHRILGRGFSEIVYKDALEWEFQQRNIPYQREKEYVVRYKDIVLPHKFYADFVVFDQIILEAKACQGLVNEHYNQVINYLAVSKCPLGLLVNFGEKSLQFKRVILSDSRPV